MMIHDRRTRDAAEPVIRNPFGGNIEGDSLKTPSVAQLNIERTNSSTWQETLRVLDRLYSELDRQGVSTTRVSRLNTYRNAVRRFLELREEKKKPNLDLAMMLMATLVELRQLRVILDALLSGKNSEVWASRLLPLVAGAEFSRNEANRSSVRDEQFESFIGAVCELSGYEVFFSEPDLIVTDGSESIGIAAKRPRNEKKIWKLYRSAVRQIRRSERPGLVAIDISFSLQRDRCINANSLEDALHLATTNVNDFIRRNYSRLSSFSGERIILGALIHLIMPAVVFDPAGDGSQMTTAVRWTVVPFKEEEIEGFRWASNFCRKCEVGLLGRKGQKPATRKEVFSLEPVSADIARFVNSAG